MSSSDGTEAAARARAKAHEVLVLSGQWRSAGGYWCGPFTNYGRPPHSRLCNTLADLIVEHGRVVAEEKAETDRAILGGNRLVNELRDERDALAAQLAEVTARAEHAESGGRCTRANISTEDLNRLTADLAAAREALGEATRDPLFGIAAELRVFLCRALYDADDSPPGKPNTLWAYARDLAAEFTAMKATNVALTAQVREARRLLAVSRSTRLHTPLCVCIDCEDVHEFLTADGGGRLAVSSPSTGVGQREHEEASKRWGARFAVPREDLERINAEVAAAAHALCSHCAGAPDEHGESIACTIACVERQAALQRAYDAGQPGAFARGLERAEAIARECGQQLIISRACGLVADAIARERTSPAAAPVEPPAEEKPLSAIDVVCPACKAVAGFPCREIHEGRTNDDGHFRRLGRERVAHGSRRVFARRATVEPPKETR